ncbi:MAG: PDZ domain-containing protein [Ilumatobacteraceae bacterium]|nr:PDZ domain-containing protein [Ilumatobacteraceae bacterium]
MSRSDWNDDEQGDPAPLPAHERAWRHPSEIGERAWVYSEPPLTIGRGLTAATGAIGGLLAMAVLWTMMPTQAGRNVVATARSTIVELTGTGLVTSRTTVPVDTAASQPQSTTPLAGVTTSVGTIGDRDPTQTSVTTTIQRPMPTYEVTVGTDLSPGAVAVSVNGGSLLITTAQAVTADLMVDLLLSDGTSSSARVLFVDDRSGLAVLAPLAGENGTNMSGIESFTVSPIVSAGDELTFGDKQMTLTVTDENTIDSVWAADDSIREGTPVVNQRGELVALCSHRDGVGRLVQLGNLDELQQAIANYTMSATVWFGIAVVNNAAGELTIDAVDPAGPAATAGLTSGDVLQSLDGSAVSDSRSITTLLAGHKPGDVVPVGVRHADGTLTTLNVTLGGPKTTL